MQLSDRQQRVRDAARRHGVTILAHTYQTPDILAVADVTGDSFALAQAAEKLTTDKVMLCGVRFMAETVKILAPQKTVLLPSFEATCPMALQFAPDQIAEYKRRHPDVTVVCYINTTAAFKAECDVCVTSSSAVRIVRALYSVYERNNVSKFGGRQCSRCATQRPSD